MDDSASSAPPQSNALYHDIPPWKRWAQRIFSAITIIMVALSMIFCLIKGKNDPTFYLLFVNVLISCVIIAFLLWWYRTGDLAANKFWFIILVASVIIFQCITTDTFVFNHDKTESTTTTLPPTVTHLTLATANHSTTKAHPPLEAFTHDTSTLPGALSPPQG